MAKKKMKRRPSKRMKKAGKKAGKVLKKDIRTAKKQDKIATVMEEFKEGKLRSGSKQGPKVKNPKQAIAIALSEAKRAASKKRKKRNK